MIHSRVPGLGRHQRRPPRQALCPPPASCCGSNAGRCLRWHRAAGGLNWTSVLPAAERTSTHGAELQAVFLDPGPSSFHFGELNLSHPGGLERESEHSGPEKIPFPFLVFFSSQGSSVLSLCRRLKGNAFHLKLVL